jgi:hypothetical protein
MRVGAISYVVEYSRKGQILKEKMRFYGCYAEASLGPKSDYDSAALTIRRKAYLAHPEAAGKADRDAGRI